MKKILTSFLFASSLALVAQEKPADPIEKRIIGTVELGFGMTSHDITKNDLGDFSLKQSNNNEISTQLGAFFSYTDNSKFIDKAKIGLFFQDDYIYLTDSENENYGLNTLHFVVPIMLGFRTGLNFNEVGDKFYKAFDWNYGIHFSNLTFSSLTNNSTKTVDNKYVLYDKAGFITEIEFSALNKDGYGHRVGLRTMSDFNSPFLNYSKGSSMFIKSFTTSVYYNIVTF